MEGENRAIFACDVSKDQINLYTELGKKRIELAFPNQSRRIEKELAELKKEALGNGYERIVVVAEATGNYHDSLLRAAKRLDLDTAWVSGEAVAKMRIIEFNDSGKTDLKDTRVIFSLARMGKTLKHRDFEEPYSLLREWNRIYEAADVAVVETKGAIHSTLTELFPDFSFKKDFLFGASGEALIECYGGNPYRIIESGWQEYEIAMKQKAPRIRKGSLMRLHNDARSSAVNGLSNRHGSILELRLGQLWHDLHLYQGRKQEAREVMVKLYEEARQIDPRVPEARKGVITAFHLARILAETGPLSDFGSWRKLLRLAGLNLCERQSGKYRGKTKTSKKGRSLLRKILGQVILPLVKETGLYGSYYHRKKNQDKMPGTKAMVVVERRFLKMLFGWYRSGEAFDRERVFTCESQYEKAA
jgi:transposase